jgi:ABC-2 type transport system permease protein
LGSAAYCSVPPFSNCSVKGRSDRNPLLRRDPAVWLLAAALVALTAAAWQTTRLGLAEHERLLQTLLREEQVRLDDMQSRIDREREELRAKGLPLAPVTFGARHATSIGHYSGGRWMVLPVLPTAPLAVGETDLQPLAHLASVDRWQGQQQAQFSSPLWQRMVRFDLQFVTAYLLPLAFIVLCAGTVAGERERGTLRLHLAQGGGVAGLGVGRVLLRGGILAAALGGTTLVLFAVDGRLEPSLSPRLALWAAGLVVYAAVWLAIIVAIDAYAKTVPVNLLAGLTAWVVVLFVAPAAVNMLADGLHPIRPRTDVERQRRQAYQETWSLKNDDVLAAFYAAHPEIPADRDARGGLERYGIYQMRLLEMMRERLLPIEAAYDEAAAARRTFVSLLRFLSPFLLWHDLATTAAGTHPARVDEFRDARQRFLDTWDAFYITRIYSREPIEDLRQTPAFGFSEPPLGRRAAAVAGSLAGLVLPAMGLFLLAARAFRRSDV